MLRGPVVGVLDTVFRERWDDPNSPDTDHPIAWIRDKLHHTRLSADPLPPKLPDPPECGPHRVQTLRTYPAIRPPYAFAPEGERSVARGYSKAITAGPPAGLPRGPVHVVARTWPGCSPRRWRAPRAAAGGRRAPVPRPGRRVRRSGPSTSGRWQAIEMCRRAGRGRVHVFDVENHVGTPVYVHAKVCVVDDVWASVGSDNFNRRSWTHDSELSSAVLDTTRDPREPRDPAGNGDGARVFARDLRLEARPRAPRPGRGRQRGRRPPRPGWVRRGRRGERGGARGLARRRPPWSPTARPAAAASPGAALAAQPALGDAGVPAARRPRRPPAEAAARTVSSEPVPDDRAPADLPPCNPGISVLCLPRCRAEPRTGVPAAVRTACVAPPAVRGLAQSARRLRPAMIGSWGRASISAGCSAASAASRTPRSVSWPTHLGASKSGP